MFNACTAIVAPSTGGQLWPATTHDVKFHFKQSGSKPFSKQNITLNRRAIVRAYQHIYNSVDLFHVTGGVQFFIAGS